MAYLEEKLEQLEKAIKAWQVALDEKYSDITRDASIQRYEFTFELLWKVIKIYLKEKEGIDCISPKSCFREIRNLLNLTEEEVETCLQMVSDRNLSTHTYSEKMAKELYDKLANYLKISNKIYKEIKEK